VTEECFLEISGQAKQARDEIARARDLMREAASGAVVSLRSLSAETRAQRELAGVLARVSEAGEAAEVAGLSRQIAQIEERIEESVDAVITALQFEDLVAQLLEHVDGRLRALGELATHVAGHESAIMHPQDDADGRASALRASVGRLREATARNPVAPGSLAGGDVELF
jgi:hypothetical protein